MEAIGVGREIGPGEVCAENQSVALLGGEKFQRCHPARPVQKKRKLINE